jgi:hypothetical protein
MTRTINWSVFPSDTMNSQLNLADPTLSLLQTKQHNQHATILDIYMYTIPLNSLVTEAMNSQLNLADPAFSPGPINE